MDGKTNFTGKEIALITGVSSSIGYELAKFFAENNYNLVLEARDKVLLEKAANNLREKKVVFTLAVIQGIFQQ